MKLLFASWGSGRLFRGLGELCFLELSLLVDGAERSDDEIRILLAHC